MAAFYKQSWFAPVASAATTFLFPSLGSAVGGAANSLLGGALSEGAANALGSSLIGGGIGALSNGAQGALTGGLAGGLTSGLMSATGLTGGLSGLLSNGTFSGAGTGAAGGFNGSGADVTRGLADRQATDAAAAAAATRKAEAVKRNTEVAGKQPPSTAKVGANHDAAGGTLDAKAVIKMPYEQFKKLDDATLSKMRGDEFVGA